MAKRPDWRYGFSITQERDPGSGMSWVVEAERTGLLAAPGEVTALAGALNRLLGNTGLRERLGARGKARFEQQFTIAAVADSVDA